VGAQPMLYFFDCEIIYEFSAKINFENKVGESSKIKEKISVENLPFPDFF